MDQQKCACGMPLIDNYKCSCEPGVCIYCCTCPEDCKCKCKKKATSDKSNTEVSD